MSAALRRPLLTTASLALALALASCTAGGADDGGASSGGSADSSGDVVVGRPAEAGTALDLAEVCPATVVMQQDWQPQAEHGGMYALVGSDYVIDADAKSVTGTLVAHGVDTGVTVEVRPGGPNVGFQSVSDLLYLDTDILVGAVNTDQAISAQAVGRPVVAVTSQLTVSPQIYMWDPATYPDAVVLADVLATGATVVTGGLIIPSLLAEQGLLDLDQVDPSYEGSPQRFVTDPSIVQQGFGTGEPFVYENEVPQWGKPVAYQYLHELGYSIYPEPVVVREADVEAEADCLERLVPVLQQSQVDYLTDAAITSRTNDLIVELVEAYQTSWTYSLPLAEYSVATQLGEDLVHDDPVSGAFGTLDPERMASIVTTFVPVLTAAGTLESGVDIDPERLYTNAFIDESISLG